MLVCVVGLGGFALQSLDQLGAQARVMDQVWTPRAEAADEMGLAAREYRISEAIRILSNSPDMVQQADEELEANGQAFEEKAAAYRAQLPSGEETASIDEIDQLWSDYLAGNEQMLALARDGRVADAAMRFRNTASQFYLLANALNALSASNAANASAASATAARINQEAHFSLTIAFIVVGFLVGVVIIYLELNVWRALRKLSALMARIASKEYDVSVQWLNSAGEVGDMARAVQVFKDNGIEKQRLEVEAEERRSEMDEARRKHDDTMAALNNQRTRAVAAIAIGLEKLSNGEMTFRLVEPLAPEFAKLQDDFNAAMDKLQEAMKVIATNATGIHVATEEISQSANDLSLRTENQAASLEEAAAALDQITATVRKTASSAKIASETVLAAKGDAERSSEIVRDAVLAMSEIAKSSQEIAQNIGVIDEIAFLTNVLALNAGVEAARAGDAGRGFAVVASEVRALAQRSANAAKEIKALISISGAQVNAGVDLVNHTGAALERILVKVKELNEITMEIAETAKDEAVGLQEVNSSIGQMDQVTQQNSAMVEESTAACLTLAHEAQQLSELIGRFEIGAASVTPVRKPQTQRAHAPRSGARSSAALATSFAEDWEEF